MRSSPRAAVYAVLTVGAAIMVFPFVWQVLTSLKSFGESIRVPPSVIPVEGSFSNYTAVLDGVPFGSMLMVSVGMTAGRVLLHVPLCAMAAYAFARLKFRGRDVLFLVFLTQLMIPPELFIIPQYEIIQGLGWLNTIQALVVPRLFSAFGVFLLRQFFLTLPVEIEEAARLDGASAWRIFWQLLLPLARPGLVALSLLTILSSWQELLWPLIVNTDPKRMPLAAGIASLRGEYFTNYPVLMAGATMAMLPLIVLFLLLQRQFIEGIAFTGGKA